MKTITFKAAYPDGERTIVMSRWTSAQFGVQVLQDNYFLAEIFKTAYGEWICSTPEKSGLTGDDIGVLIEIIEREFDVPTDYPERPPFGRHL